MEGHVKRVIDAVNAQFGPDTGEQVFTNDRPTVMNKVSALDSMFEVVVDGYILGRLRFDIDRLDYTFLCSLEGGRRIGKHSERSWIRIYDGVLDYLKKGANLMLPGVSDQDPCVKVGDEVLVIDSEGAVVAVGRARMSGREMQEQEKGFAVKIRQVSDATPPSVNGQQASWDDAVDANSNDIIAIEKEACSFIKRTVERTNDPVIVGFSGGKDSLVTYLLVEKALGRSPPLFFMDTGLEFPETIEYVTQFAEGRGTDIIGRTAGDQFWESMETFGPPARDFRWCCKVLKLGPAASGIAEDLEGQVLSFLGQRKLESFRRSIEPRVTTNPWVPGQISASPIQNWNGLEVWLYIFKEEAPFNPLYNVGYHRMGCYLCPAASLAELKQISETHPDLYRRWRTEMESWAKEYGLPEEWIDRGFWRWKQLPPGQMELVRNLGLTLKSNRPTRGQQINLEIIQGVSPCTAAQFSLEGQFSRGLDLNRVGNLMPIFGETKVSDELGALRTKRGQNSIMMFSTGSLTVRGPKENTIEQLADQIERTVRRAVLCQACGSCLPQCEQDALELKDGKVSVDIQKCTQCLKCDSWPCPTYLT
jgi:phosphoadenosine phosphosulfate reductase